MYWKLVLPALLIPCDYHCPVTGLILLNPPTLNNDVEEEKEKDKEKE